MRALLARWKSSRLGRTWERYGTRRGPILAGGVAYAALFSVFGALVAGFSVFGLVLGSDQQLFDDVATAVDAQLPGLLDIGPDGGPIDPEVLVDPDLVSITGVIAFATALFAGLGWLDALREALRAVLGLPPDEHNFAAKKLADVGVLTMFGLGILLSAVTSVVVNAAASALLQAVGLDGGQVGSVMLQLLALAVVAVVDAALLWGIFRVLVGLRLPWAQVRGPVLVGGLALALLVSLSGLLVGSAGGRNPLLATGAVLVGLLVLLNLVSRIMLLVATWLSTGPGVDDERLDHEGVDAARARTRAEVDLRKHAIAAPPRVQPSYSARAADRTTIAAGVVLGAVAVTTLRVVGQGVSTLVRSARRR